MVKILVIDDNTDNLITFEAIMREAMPDSEVITARSGEEGITRALQTDPDAIVLDILMPGMDGFETCRELKRDERLRDIPVVFLTAMRSDRDSRVKALELGAEAFLTKPIDSVELTAQVGAMVKVKAANRLLRDEKDHLERLVAERTADLERSKLAMLNLLEDLQAENEERRRAEVGLRERLDEVARD